MAFTKDKVEIKPEKVFKTTWDEDEMWELSAKYDNWESEYGILKAETKFLQNEGVVKIYDRKFTFAVLYDGEYNFDRYEQALLKYRYFMRWKQYVNITICHYGIKNYRKPEQEDDQVEKSRTGKMDVSKTGKEEQNHNFSRASDYLRQGRTAQNGRKEIRGQNDREVSENVELSSIKKSVPANSRR